MATLIGTATSGWNAMPVAVAPLARGDLKAGDVKMPLHIGVSALGGQDAGVQVGSFSLSDAKPEQAFKILVEHNAAVAGGAALPGTMKLIASEDAKFARPGPGLASLSGSGERFASRTRIAGDDGSFVDVIVDIEGRSANIETGKMTSGMTESVSLRVDADGITTGGIMFTFDARNEEFLKFLNKLGAAQEMRFSSTILSDALLIKAAELLFAAQFGSDVAPEMKFFGKPIQIGSAEYVRPDAFSMTQVKLAPVGDKVDDDARDSGAAVEITKRAFGRDVQYQVLIRRPDGFAMPRMGLSEELFAAGLARAIGAVPSKKEPLVLL